MLARYSPLEEHCPSPWSKVQVGKRPFNVSLMHSRIVKRSSPSIKCLKTYESNLKARTKLQKRNSHREVGEEEQHNCFAFWGVGGIEQRERWGSGEGDLA